MFSSKVCQMQIWLQEANQSAIENSFLHDHKSVLSGFQSLHAQLLNMFIALVQSYF